MRRPGARWADEISSAGRCSAAFWSESPASDGMGSDSRTCRLPADCLAGPPTRSTRPLTTPRTADPQRSTLSGNSPAGRSSLNPDQSASELPLQSIEGGLRAGGTATIRAMPTPPPTAADPGSSSQAAAGGAESRDRPLRNVAIIAHVDHGKTSLVDSLLAASGVLGRQSGSGAVSASSGKAGSPAPTKREVAAAAAAATAGDGALIMDSDPLERERGITIFSKQCAIDWLDSDGNPVRINLVDTPGHADFGGEVERVLRMADSALLLVDAFEGPMPQTRFVLEKALAEGLRVLLLVNKCDRPDARPDGVVDEVFDLLVALGADDTTLEFDVLYASARDGWATRETPVPGAGPPEGANDMLPLLDTIVRDLPSPAGDPDAPLQMLITSIDYSEYVGRIAIGRVMAGSITAGQRVAVCRADGKVVNGRALKTLRFLGLGRQPADSVTAGDLCAIEGLETFDIGDTVADLQTPVALPRVTVDEPTLHMVFRTNDSPGSGREGTFVTSRQIEDRLKRETMANVALRVEPGDGPDEFKVSGRGLLHLGVLIENMRREGFELTVGRPEVVIREIDGVKSEPMERLTVHVPEAGMGAVIELLGTRGAEISHVEPRGDRMHLEAELPASALIGLRPRLLTATGGEAVIDHAFSRWAPVRETERRRPVGVMVATEDGQARAYALQTLGERGVMFVIPADPIYRGQLVGENARAGDLDVNAARNKAHSNVRESNKDATVVLKSARQMGLEEALEYIETDELVEVTPKAVRLRKRQLDQTIRKRDARQAKDRTRDQERGG
ncbi:MAG: GTP-binding protein TypA/BipA [Phycisphaerales bacterium]